MNTDYGVKTGKWGPYNKDYLGICHIADENKGATFNVELFTGFTKRTLLSQKVLGDNGVKMWSANKDLTKFSYRYEIEWKDKVYLDATFTVFDDKEVYIDCNFVNNTDLYQNCTVDLATYITYPSKKWWYNFIDFKPVYDPVVAETSKYINAVDYTDICCSQKYSADGLKLAETFRDNASGKGSCINSDFFGKNKEHFLRYDFERLYADGIGIRYSCQNDTTIFFEIGGFKIPLKLKASNDFSFEVVKFPEQEIHSFSVYGGGEPICIDSFVVGKNAEKTCFIKRKYNTKSNKELLNDGMVLSFDGIRQSYFVGWDTPQKLVCKFDSDNLGEILSEHIHNSLFNEIESGKEQKCFYDVAVSNPIIIAPHSEKKIKYYIASGSSDKCKSAKFSEAFCPEPKPFLVDCNAEGEKFKFSQNMLSYNTLLNVVYPVYERGNYIIHTIPGRLWDSMYTWDNGFIGLGLSVIDFDRAFDCLKTFLTPQGDIHAPFIMSGTLMPTQILLYAELVNAFGDRKELKEIYSEVKQYYSFYSDLKNDENQTGSGLLKLWHLNYNSGGWDDYPPQKALTFNIFNSENHKSLIKGNADTTNTTPVIVTAITVLIAKIMKQIAERFGFTEDVSFYNEDIDYYSSAIQKYCYDEQSGYFQYVVHDYKGIPSGFLRYKDGTLFNLGFDGIYPYMSGICNEKQSAKIIYNIKNGLMTDCGVGTVDLRAPYYSDNGYWNGTVWFPHQWILWKSLLDNGQSELATEIAIKALTVYDNEMKESYCSFENFTVKTKRGNGYHQFSGLTCPCLSWFKAYFTPGTISCGFFVQISDIEKSKDNDYLEFNFKTDDIGRTVLVCMNSNFKYRILTDGEEVKADFDSPIGGAYYIKLNKTVGKITIKH